MSTQPLVSAATTSNISSDDYKSLSVGSSRDAKPDASQFSASSLQKAQQPPSVVTLVTLDVHTYQRLIAAVKPEGIVMPDNSLCRDFIVLQDGSLYVGECQDGKPHGKGFSKPYPNSRWADEGIFKDGKLWTGQRYTDESIPKNSANRGTDFIDLSKHPYNGDGRYVGELLEGKPHGWGTYYPCAWISTGCERGEFIEGKLWNGSRHKTDPNGRETWLQVREGETIYCLCCHEFARRHCVIL